MTRGSYDPSCSPALKSFRVKLFLFSHMEPSTLTSQLGNFVGSCIEQKMDASLSLSLLHCRIPYIILQMAPPSLYLSPLSLLRSYTTFFQSPTSIDGGSGSGGDLQRHRLDILRLPRRPHSVIFAEEEKGQISPWRPLIHVGRRQEGQRRRRGGQGRQGATRSGITTPP